MYSFDYQLKYPYQRGECAKSVAQQRPERSVIYLHISSCESVLVDPDHVLCPDERYFIDSLGLDSPTVTVNTLKWHMEYGYIPSKDALIDACRFGKTKVVQYLVDHDCPITTVP